MAPRSFWKGYLKLSLVTCPVAMTPAVSEGDRVRFHTLNAETGHRIETRYVDSETGKPVADDDQVRGYPVGEDKYIILEDEELEAVLDEAQPEVEALGHPTLRVEAMLARGRLDSQRGRFTEAAQELEQGYLLAVESGLDDMATFGATHFAFVLLQQSRLDHVLDQEIALLMVEPDLPVTQHLVPPERRDCSCLR